MVLRRRIRRRVFPLLVSALPPPRTVFFVRNFLLVQFQRNGISGCGRRRRCRRRYCRRRRRYRRRLRTLIRSWRKSSIVEKRLVAHSVADATDRLFGTLELSMSRTKTLIAKIPTPQNVDSRVYRQPSHVVTFEWSVAR